MCIRDSIYILVFGEQHRSTVTALHNLVLLLKAQGQWKEGLALSEKVVDLRRQLQAGLSSEWTGSEEEKEAQGRQDAQSLASALNAMGELRAGCAQGTEASQAFEEALSILNDHGLGNSDAAAAAHSNQAKLLMSVGDTVAAVEQAEKVVGIRLILNGATHTLFATAVEQLAGCYQANGEEDRSKALMDMLAEQFQVKSYKPA
eukprot:TRINITY_DN10354_c0_g1_i4.p1 TRINITY_DN10354_c0_g1~~TRINITY_DN10354_c0_g1_i4.p1  ORF type:complete len:203 (-),score=72.76 TRINITY_DN10354_c0_g1_i4:261-869(-)